MSGKELIETLAGETGLPSDLVLEEVRGLIEKIGVKETQITLEDLREVLEEYLQDTLLEAKKHYSGASEAG